MTRRPMVLTLAALAGSAAAHASGLFLPQVTFPVGGGPTALAIGDVDGDEIPDIVVANFNDELHVLLGVGDGAFTTTTPRFPAVPAPGGLALGLFNADSNLDVAIATAAPFGLPGSATVLLGDGDGTFGPESNLDAGQTPNAIVAQDVNGDTHVDLVVADVGAPQAEPPIEGRLWVRFGAGDGTFASSLDWDAGDEPRALDVADLNDDQVLDVAVVNASGVAILLGVAPGGVYAGSVTYAAGSGPSSVAIGLFNADAIPDLAVTNAVSDDVSILLGNGDGTFGASVEYLAGDNPQHAETDDLDGDGVLDLAIANENSDDVSILKGAGDGTFGAPMSAAAGAEPDELAIADLNGDGAPDIVVVNAMGSTASVLLNRGPCRADFDGCGQVDSMDLALLLGSWGTNDPLTDIDGSGTVGPEDLALLLGEWGDCS